MTVILRDEMPRKPAFTGYNGILGGVLRLGLCWSDCIPGSRRRQWASKWNWSWRNPDECDPLCYPETPGRWKWVLPWNLAASRSGRVKDWGVPFNPLERPDPPNGAKSFERQWGAWASISSDIWSPNCVSVAGGSQYSAFSLYAPRASSEKLPAPPARQSVSAAWQDKRIADMNGRTGEGQPCRSIQHKSSLLVFGLLSATAVVLIFFAREELEQKFWNPKPVSPKRALSGEAQYENQYGSLLFISWRRWNNAKPR